MSASHHTTQKRKQQARDRTRRGADHSGALCVIRPAKTTSQQCTHHWGCVSEAILQMSLLCPLSPGWAGHCVCVIDTRRHGEAACDISAAVSFMQLHRRRQDTSNHAHRCHRRMCVCGSPKGSAARRCSETQHRVEGHPTSITVDVISTEGAQVYCAGRVLVYWKSVALDASTPMLLFHTRLELKQSHRQKNASRNRLCGNNRARPGGYFSLFQNLQNGSPEKKNCCSLFTRDCGSQAVLSCSYRM